MADVSLFSNVNDGLLHGSLFGVDEGTQPGRINLLHNKYCDIKPFCMEICFPIYMWILICGILACCRLMGYLIYG
jgi:hypothetical protein